MASASVELQGIKPVTIQTILNRIFTGKCKVVT